MEPAGYCRGGRGIVSGRRSLHVLELHQFRLAKFSLPQLGHVQAPASFILSSGAFGAGVGLLRSLSFETVLCDDASVGGGTDALVALGEVDDSGSFWDFVDARNGDPFIECDRSFLSFLLFLAVFFSSSRALRSFDCSISLRSALRCSSSVR